MVTQWSILVHLINMPRAQATMTSVLIATQCFPGQCVASNTAHRLGPGLTPGYWNDIDHLSEICLNLKYHNIWFVYLYFLGKIMCKKWHYYSHFGKISKLICILQMNQFLWFELKGDFQQIVNLATDFCATLQYIYMYIYMYIYI